MERVWSERDGSSQTTHVRILLGSWGLYVDLVARLDSAEITEGWPADVVQIGPHLGLDVSGVSVAREDLTALVAGVKQREAAFPVPGGPQICVVRVDMLTMPLTDYQPEAATIAASTWASDLLGVERTPFRATFDRVANRYSVTFQVD